MGHISKNKVSTECMLQAKHMEATATSADVVVYIFLGEGHHFVLYVLNVKATLWHKLHKLYSFLKVNQQTNKCCFQKQQQPNHA